MKFSEEEKKQLLSNLGYKFRTFETKGEDRYEIVTTGKSTEVYLTDDLSSHIGELNAVFDLEFKKRISTLF